MASNPEIKTCALGAWTPVAINVTSAMIHKKIVSTYFHTYRLTGVAAPTTLADGIEMLDQSLEYNHSAAIDIYIWAAVKAGSVRVDV